MKETDYKYAQRNPEFRQEFLDNIDMERYKSFVGSIVYVEGELREKRIMETKQPESTQKLYVQSIIRIPAYTFESLSYHEFYNILVHHEGIHAVQDYFDPIVLDEDLCKKSLSSFVEETKSCLIKTCQHEIEAHRNQMKHPSFDKCSIKIREGTKDWLNKYLFEFDSLTK
ncbi:MAG: hypothetical protein OEL87_02800 [Nanoarchaeota archaeon]|nr:hypothetical protein [Nanoarchaeota archaeon]